MTEELAQHKASDQGGAAVETGLSVVITTRAGRERTG
jgi:hypothetical protein